MARVLVGPAISLYSQSVGGTAGWPIVRSANLRREGACLLSCVAPRKPINIGLRSDFGPIVQAAADMPTDRFIDPIRSFCDLRHRGNQREHP